MIGVIEHWGFQGEKMGREMDELGKSLGVVLSNKTSVVEQSVAEEVSNLVWCLHY